jgi:putative transposase
MDPALENRALKDLIDPKALTPSEKCDAVTYLQTAHRISIARACAGVGLSRAA